MTSYQCVQHPEAPADFEQAADDQNETQSCGESCQTRKKTWSEASSPATAVWWRF